MKKPLYQPGARSNINLFDNKKLDEKQQQERDEYIGEKYNTIFDQMMKKSKQNLIQNIGFSNEAVFNREM